MNIDYLGTPFGPKVGLRPFKHIFGSKIDFRLFTKNSLIGKPRIEKQPKRPFLATFFKLHVSNVRAHDFMGVQKVAEPRKIDHT